MKRRNKTSNVQSQTRAYKSQTRLNRNKARIDNSNAVKTARLDKQKAIKEANINRRANKRQTKIAVKSAKQLQKIYGDLDPNQVNSINALKPYLPMMQKALDEKGIEYDQSDPIETVNKYAMQEELLDLPYDDDEYNDAFINDEGDYETNAEHFFNMEKAKKTVASAVPYVLGAVSGIVEVAKDKRKQDLPLSKTETQLLNTTDKVEKTIKNKVVATVGEKAKDSLPIIVLIILLIFIIK